MIINMNISSISISGIINQYESVLKLLVLLFHFFVLLHVEASAELTRLDNNKNMQLYGLY